MPRVNDPPPTPTVVTVPTVAAGMKAIVEWWRGSCGSGGYGPPMKSRAAFEEMLTRVGRARIHLGDKALLVVLEEGTAPEDESGAAED